MLTDNFTDEVLQNVIDNFIAESEAKSEFTVRYYYVKYDHFRPGSYGKYTWEDHINKPYEMAVMQTETKWSENTYQPFLKLVDDKRLSRDYCGQYIILENVYIECANDAYLIKSNDTEEEVDRIAISQNEAGIDVENRIEMLKSLYSSIKTKY